MIEFLEWLGENNWYACDKGWFTTKGKPCVTREVRKYYTSEELVEKFKTKTEKWK